MSRNRKCRLCPHALRQVSYGVMKKFEELTEREVLALAIALEEEDERVYADFAEGLRQDYPATASMFDGMREEESGHRRRLIELFQKKFGEHIPLIRRQDVRGFVERPALWLVRPLRIEAVRKEASTMEVETRRFLRKGGGAHAGCQHPATAGRSGQRRTRARRARAGTRQAETARQREGRRRSRAAPLVRAADRAARAGGPDGWSVSTLAPVFAAAFATQEQLGCVSGRPGGIGRRGHQHGICRSPFR